MPLLSLLKRQTLAYMPFILMRKLQKQLSSRFQPAVPSVLCSTLLTSPGTALFTSSTFMETDSLSPTTTSDKTLSSPSLLFRNSLFTSIDIVATKFESVYASSHTFVTLKPGLCSTLQFFQRRGVLPKFKAPSSNKAQAVNIDVPSSVLRSTNRVRHTATAAATTRVTATATATARVTATATATATATDTATATARVITTVTTTTTASCRLSSANSSDRGHASTPTSATEASSTVATDAVDAGLVAPADAVESIHTWSPAEVLEMIPWEDAHCVGKISLVPEGHLLSRYGKSLIVGQGGNGIVSKHSVNVTIDDAAFQFDFAIKNFTFSNGESVDERRQIVLSEVGIQRSLSHQNVARIFSVFEEACDTSGIGELYCVMELGEMDLAAYINRPEYDCSMAPVIFLQLLDAIHYLHCSEHIGHSDIKPGNLLITSDKVLKVIDFGCALKCPPSSGVLNPIAPIGCTLQYAPPDILPFNFDTKVDIMRMDIWAVAIVLLNLVKAQGLWDEPSFADEAFRLFASNPAAFIKSKLPNDSVYDDAIDVLVKMMALDPLDHISIVEIFETPFVLGLIDQYFHLLPTGI
ncbi:kinase-like protein [Ramicandelaber brevisporus]|nr:kinase-like protein [Ramicandelaber brevisporus]